MKKLNLLSKAEMKNVVGGILQATFNCTCYQDGQTTTFQITWDNNAQMVHDINVINANCNSGSGCTAA